MPKSARQKKGVKRTAKPVPKKRARGVTQPATADHASRNLAHLFAQLCHDKKGIEPVVLDLRKLSSFTDYFLICTGSSDRHVQAMADGLEEIAKQHGRRLSGSEGYTQGQWVLLDFGDVVAHIFQPDIRAFYDLDGLWRDAPRVKFKLT